MRNEVLRIGAPEHEHPDGPVGLSSLNERNQIADELGPQQVHGRGRDLREEDGPFSAFKNRRSGHGLSGSRAQEVHANNNASIFASSPAATFSASRFSYASSK